MSRRALIHPLAAIAFGFLVPAALLAQAAPTLAFGTVLNGKTGTSGAPARYRVATDAAGVLTVAASGDADLVLAVTDESGQVLRDGTADIDLRGQVGSEYLAVVLPRAGQYSVEVRTNGDGEGHAFRLSAGFAPMPVFEMPDDPDGRPTGARALTVGTAHNDELNPDAGDLADWYSVTASEAMTLIIVTRVEEGVDGDLVLEAFRGTDLSEAAERSDQDLNGHAGNESLTLDVKAGETIRFKVATLGDSGGAVAYRVSLGRMP